MGEVANTLGVGGNGEQKYPADIYPDAVNQTLGAGSSGFMLPGINEPSPQAMQAMPSTQGGGAGAQSPMADTWQPHHRTTLGKIADITLALLGLPIAPFKKKEERDNMHEAMQGFATDPLRTIERISQIRGHEGDALKLYEQYVDDKRQDGNLSRQNNVFDLQKQDLVYKRVAGMMGAANEGTWGKMRSLALDMGNRLGVDVSPYVPEAYDPDSIEFIRNGAIKPIDQVKAEETHDYHGKVIDTRERGQDLSHGDRVRGQNLSHGDRIRGQDLSHGDRVTNEAGRNARHNDPKTRTKAGVPPAVMTKYGPLVPSKSDPRKAILHHGGKTYGYTNINGTWVPVGEVELK